ncbi:hypothetical protein [Massilia sp. HP4]|uniref:hypothetical protein n=1 Tax=Massilia sp. HP4 TaxID=2562316 RepID=UPI0010BF9965|nr:hypothetical protein [Massilia sp. HP4]
MGRYPVRVATPGKRSMLLALSLAWHAFATAADVLPAHLTGTWGTAESLFAGEDEQVELRLLPDGYGVMAGSTPPARRMDGSNATVPDMRIVMGFPLRATFAGDTLTARMIALDPRQEDEARRTVITCRFDAGGQTLTCTVPAGPPVLMTRRSEKVSEDTIRTIEEVRTR